ncbi:hypothetical protein Taro_013155 [Colocasia esculenta]|uniref:Uncharacterized protein n=1 Tax=Colocasia esculenta TaxID=4460 RepID=A0A843UF51_COLES|nr:hypothetical protein [Colocasia esculenta]
MDQGPPGSGGVKRRVGGGSSGSWGVSESCRVGRGRPSPPVLPLFSVSPTYPTNGPETAVKLELPLYAPSPSSSHTPPVAAVFSLFLPVRGRGLRGGTLGSRCGAAMVPRPQLRLHYCSSLRSYVAPRIAHELLITLSFVFILPVLVSPNYL